MNDIYIWNRSIISTVKEHLHYRLDKEIMADLLMIWWWPINFKRRARLWILAMTKRNITEIQWCCIQGRLTTTWWKVVSGMSGLFFISLHSLTSPTICSLMLTNRTTECSAANTYAWWRGTVRWPVAARVSSMDNYDRVNEGKMLTEIESQ